MLVGQQIGRCVATSADHEARCAINGFTTIHDCNCNGFEVDFQLTSVYLLLSPTPSDSCGRLQFKSVPERRSMRQHDQCERLRLLLRQRGDGAELFE